MQHQRLTLIKKITLGGCLLALASVCVFAQGRRPRPGPTPRPTPVQTPTIPNLPQGSLATQTKQQKQEALCRAQPMAEARTYKFRILPPDVSAPSGAYGKEKKNLLDKLAFWQNKGDRRWTQEELKALRKEIAGRVIPIGESERSFGLRMKLESSVTQDQKEAEANWKKWLAQNRKATPAQKKAESIKIRLRLPEAITRPKFDWRLEGLDVGPVGSQGDGCNDCWAFASLDAIRASRQLSAIRMGNPEPDKTLKPSVRQLVSCMIPAKESAMRCQVNWHGDVFTHFVDYGVPLGGATGYTENKDVRTVWECDAPSVEKGLTWDYVTTTPHLVPKEEEIKRALILYGPLVASVTWEDCFTLYGGGIFNEAFIKTNEDDLPHLLLIIGWDDTKKSWLVKNGYGTGWGEKGFGWIKYGSNSIGRSAAWVMADPEAKIEPMVKKPESK